MDAGTVARDRVKSMIVAETVGFDEARHPGSPLAATSVLATGLSAWVSDAKR